MFNAEKFVEGLTAQALSELRALLNSEEYVNLTEDWREGFDRSDDDNDE